MTTIAEIECKRCGMLYKVTYSTTYEKNKKVICPYCFALNTVDEEGIAEISSRTNKGI